MKRILIVGSLLFAGCAGGGIGSNQADFIKALAVDPASNCVVVNTPYGGLLVARGTPGAEVTLAGGSCAIKSSPAPTAGTANTSISVPVQVTPAVTVGTPTINPVATPSR